MYVLLVVLSALAAETRVWSDVSGKHTLEAAYVSREGDQVKLRRSDGSMLTIPLERLSPPDREYVHQLDPSAVKRPAASVAAPVMDLETLVARVEPSVVRVETDEGLGSGVLVRAGVVATNFHVIEGSRSARVVFANELSVEVEGYLIAEAGRDLALLRLKPGADAAPLPLRSDLPNKGEKVVAFGAPRGFGGTVTDGIVSSIRSGADLKPSLFEKSVWLQHTAPISPGNSGGPLVDVQGRVAGLNTLTRIDGQNLNFAVASSEIIDLLSRAPAESQPLAALAPARPTPLPGPSSGTTTSGLAFEPVLLPSGRSLERSLVELPAN